MSAASRDALAADMRDERMKECAGEMFKVAKNAAATILSIYEQFDRVEAAGGAISIEGVAACHAMLKSLSKNRTRVDDLVMHPLLAVVAKVEGKL